jgi:hypothetical protein
MTEAQKAWIDAAWHVVDAHRRPHRTPSGARRRLPYLAWDYKQKEPRYSRGSFHHKRWRRSSDRFEAHLHTLPWVGVVV